MVDRLYIVLAPGEADREKLTSPRWQAEFDLAMGRVLATEGPARRLQLDDRRPQARQDLPERRQHEWILEAADAFETESTIRKMAERAKMYLERVVKDHPGTPWAKIAEEELKNPLGWTWKES